MFIRLLRCLLPGTCLLCEVLLPADNDLDLCPPCLAALPWNNSACPQCGAPGAATGPAVVAGPCADCRRRPPPFALTVAPLRYESYARLWVGRLKDRLGMVEGRVLGMLLAEAAAVRYAAAPADAPDGPAPDLIVPVPLRPTRLARRGHNQALTLAGPVARRLGIPLARHVAFRQRAGARQRGLSRRQRLRNPIGAFAIRRTWPEPGPRIAIVDDVVTTGATAAELARCLLAAGAREVHVLCAARTPRSGSN